eukprot:SAG22_NODE_295_length_12850_cov_9.179202_3_plen_336_part_00
MQVQAELEALLGVQPVDECSRVRKERTVPVIPAVAGIALTVHARSNDRATALHGGAPLVPVNVQYEHVQGQAVRLVVRDQLADTGLVVRPVAAEPHAVGTPRHHRDPARDGSELLHPTAIVVPEAEHVQVPPAPSSGASCPLCPPRPARVTVVPQGAVRVVDDRPALPAEEALLHSALVHPDASFCHHVAVHRVQAPVQVAGRAAGGVLPRVKLLSGSRRLVAAGNRPAPRVGARVYPVSGAPVRAPDLRRPAGAAAPGPGRPHGNIKMRTAQVHTAIVPEQQLARVQRERAGRRVRDGVARDRQGSSVHKGDRGAVFKGRGLDAQDARRQDGDP